MVDVPDPTSAGTQPRGKQILDPSGIWYTAVSGIWQTVWIEPVPKLHIADVRATPDIDRGVIDVAVALSGWAGDTDEVRLNASAGGKQIAQTIIRANRSTTLDITDRSEERSGGKDRVSQCSSRWWTDRYKKKQ